jgi:hypothetical protein
VWVKIPGWDVAYLSDCILFQGDKFGVVYGQNIINVSRIKYDGISVQKLLEVYLFQVLEEYFRDCVG